MRTESESNRKRMEFHSKIRSDQKNKYFQSIREQYSQENASNTQDLSRNNFQNADPMKNSGLRNRSVADDGLMEDGFDQRIQKKKRIEMIIERAHVARIGMGKQKHLSSMVVKKIWDLAMSSSSQPCLTEKSLIQLLNQAKQDINRLTIKQLQKNERKNVSERLGQILWILVNQCFHGEELSEETSLEIIKLCISIIRWKGGNQRQASQEEVDDHISGLCVILLGNSCVNEKNVKMITKEIKISSMFDLLQGLVEAKNEEDLTFLISNVLFYYPTPETILEQIFEVEMQEEGFSELSVKENQLQLLKILTFLYDKLSQDQLIHLNRLSEIKQISLTPKKLGTPKEKKNNLLGVSQKQSKKIAQMKARGVKDAYLSIYYTNDLMQSICHIKFLLSELRALYEKHEDGNEGGYSSQMNRKLSELRRACFKLQSETSETEMETILLVIKLMLFYDKIPLEQEMNSGQKLIRVSNMLIFLRDVFRDIGYIKAQKEGEANPFNKRLEEQIISKRGEALLEFIHRKIETYKEAEHPSQGKQSKQEELIESINKTVWEIYACILDFISSPQRPTFAQTYHSEITWLQTILYIKSNPNHSQNRQKIADCQQSRTISFLAKYYDIATVTHQHRRPSETEQISQLSYDNVEIDISKIDGILNLFYLKLNEYKDQPTTILNILRAIQTVVDRFKNYQYETEGNSVKKGKQWPSRSELLGKQLHKLLVLELLNRFGMKQHGQVSNQICETIQEIVRQDYNQSQEMDVEETDQRLEMRDGPQFQSLS